MNSSKKIPLVLAFAVLTALVMFAVLRVTTLTRKVQTLENIVNSRQESPLSQSTDLVQGKAAPPNGSKHKVLNVVDGDTITIETTDGSVTVRVIDAFVSHSENETDMTG